MRSGSIAVPAPRTGIGPRRRADTGYVVPRTGRLQRERHAPEYAVLIAVVALAAIGILMVYSSSAVRAYVQRDDPFAIVGPQVLWAMLGVVAMLVAMRIDYRYLRLVSLVMYGIALVLLVLVLLPGVGRVVGGSARWLQIGSLPAVHPAEFAKLALVVYLAHWLAGRGTRIRSIRGGTIPFLVLVLPLIVLVIREPDLGTTGVLTLTAFTMFFIAGANLWQFLLLVPAGIAAVAAIVAAHSYQLARVQAFLDPWKDPQGIGFHTIQGLLALGLGGLFGAGLGGHSRQAGGLELPNASNDYIFAVIGEEFGVVGAAVVIALFAVLAVYGIRVALGAPDTFGGLLATGITAWLTFQAFINIGVVVALVPITGITLPFVSAGGSSLIVSFAAVGILLSISRETHPRRTWSDADPDRGRRNGRPHLSGLGSGAGNPRPPRGR